MHEKQFHAFSAESFVTARVAVSPDGRFVLSGGGRVQTVDGQNVYRKGDDTLRLWRLPVIE